VLARRTDAPPLAGRELADAWEATLEASGLPVHRPAGRARGRVAFAAPLPLGVAAERELADIALRQRVPIWQVREGLGAHLPIGWTLVDLFDVWPGAPALAGRVVAADYRVALRNVPDPGQLETAVRSLLEAKELPRSRQKGEGVVAYDLRALLVDIVLEGEPDPTIRMRTRIHPELGTGRPEEVMAQIGERIGAPLEVQSVVRERLVLSDDAG
jgi:radical SAM-linked protein